MWEKNSDYYIELEQIPLDLFSHSTSVPHAATVKTWCGLHWGFFIEQVSSVKRPDEKLSVTKYLHNYYAILLSDGFIIRSHTAESWFVF